MKTDSDDTCKELTRGSDQKKELNRLAVIFITINFKNHQQWQDSNFFQHVIISSFCLGYLPLYPLLNVSLTGNDRPHNSSKMKN